MIVTNKKRIKYLFLKIISIFLYILYNCENYDNKYIKWIDEDSNVINAELSKTNQELKAINAINKLKSDVCTSLFCLVDYKGFRLVACALMPLDEKVIYYN